MHEQHRESLQRNVAAQLSLLETGITDDLPPGAAELLRSAADEVLGAIPGANTVEGRRVFLLEEGQCVAMGTVFPAESASLVRATGLDAEALTGSVALADVHVEAGRQEDLLPVLLYLLLRRARIWGRHTVLTYVDPMLLTGPKDVVCWQRLPNLMPPTDNGRSTPRMPVAQRLDIAIHKAYAASVRDGQKFLKQFFVPEAVESLEIHVDRFFRTEFFRAVYDSSLSREQYVYSMSNLHQFVRYTTRLIGRAVGLSNDEELRNHWLAHLSGEINHEKIIEKDLRNLGADVEYVVQHMLPNVPNQEFMVMQESVIAFHQDPVLFMAAPFAAEGWTARLDERFIRSLEKAVASWGVENPRHVTSFLASHINYDGGDDGHWEGTRKILGRYLLDDQMLQKFLNLVHLAMNAFERSYASYITEQRLWSAAPMRAKASAVEARTSVLSPS